MLISLFVYILYMFEDRSLSERSTDLYLEDSTQIGFSETEWHFDLINYIVLNGQLYVGCQGKLLLGFACVF